jgi:hypothetical protein
MVLTLSMLRTRNSVSPRLRAWALAHSTVAARSIRSHRRAAGSEAARKRGRNGAGMHVRCSSRTAMAFEPRPLCVRH